MPSNVDGLQRPRAAKYEKTLSLREIREQIESAHRHAEETYTTAESVVSLADYFEGILTHSLDELDPESVRGGLAWRLVLLQRSAGREPEFAEYLHGLTDALERTCQLFELAPKPDLEALSDSLAVLGLELSLLLPSD